MDTTALIDVLMYVAIAINFAVAAGLLATVVTDRRSGPQGIASPPDLVATRRPAQAIAMVRAPSSVGRLACVSLFDAIGSSANVPNCHKNAA